LYKIVIADDEIHILRLIKRFVTQENITVVGEAQNGIDAYNLTLQLKPDILITDIRMPGYDGIEMIKKLNGEMPDLSIIIISGYRDFEYAQEAIRYGVMEYLLKPIRETDLKSALAKAINKSLEVRNSKQHVETMKKSLDETSQALKLQALQDFLFKGDAAADKLQAEKDLPDFLLKQNQIFFVIILKIDNSDNEQTFEANRKEVAGSLSRKVTGILDKSNCHYQTFFQNSRTYIICSMDRADNPKVLPEKALNDINMLLRSETYKYIFLKATISIGIPTENIGDLPKSLQSAEQFLTYRLKFPNEYIFGCWCVSRPDFKRGNIAAKKYVHELKNAVETMNSSKAEAVFLTIHDDFSKNYYESYELIGIANFIIKEIDSSVRHADPSDDLNPLVGSALLAVDNATDPENILAFLKKFTLAVIDLLLDLQEQRVSRPVRLAQEYIQQNFDKQVTLEEVAEIVFINPNYLSSLFKAKTGVGFSEYVATVKVEKAKELLRTTFMNINEIAFAVGYMDTKRFSKMFIKYEGIRPSEYRKFYS
jgi:two-component system response regulator YesN